MIFVFEGGWMWLQVWVHGRFQLMVLEGEQKKLLKTEGNGRVPVVFSKSGSRFVSSYLLLCGPSSTCRELQCSFLGVFILIWIQCWNIGIDFIEKALWVDSLQPWKSHFSKTGLTAIKIPLVFLLDFTAIHMPLINDLHREKDHQFVVWEDKAPRNSYSYSLCKVCHLFGRQVALPEIPALG